MAVTWKKRDRLTRYPYRDQSQRPAEVTALPTQAATVPDVPRPILRGSWSSARSWRESHSPSGRASPSMRSPRCSTRPCPSSPWPASRRWRVVTSEPAWCSPPSSARWRWSATTGRRCCAGPERRAVSLLLWVAAGVLAGSVMGAAVWTMRQPRSASPPPWVRGLAVGFWPGIALGEAAHGLIRIADTTPTAYWWTQAVVGVAVLVVLAARCLDSLSSRVLSVGRPRRRGSAVRPLRPAVTTATAGDRARWRTRVVDGGTAGGTVARCVSSSPRARSTTSVG